MVSCAIELIKNTVTMGKYYVAPVLYSQVSDERTVERDRVTLDHSTDATGISFPVSSAAVVPSAMSETEWNTTGGQTTAKYSTDCRNCERTVHGRVPVRLAVYNANGVHVRCRECRTTNFIRREDSGNE